MLNAVGFEPVFSYGRTTGLASNMVSGNPSIDLVNKSFAALRGVTASAVQRDYNFSQQDMRAMTSITSFQNAMV